ncbi:TetR/AcrR family transcriptional regulator [Chitinilyticum piscinae]|uniref:TetR/AcrR family transcriptional regulator n=1 Tax=Chitinilyticum piscinae TaxID=2866724 RepID=A0A8J7FQT2_9NEIS|nr:TetR/AcrR family transcriptional regulator [Chitinilyticum piscinae]MBE9610589.1 TetR/AcrR family transcriptional regulator [Chitinilyticum piscinae]
MPEMPSPRGRRKEARPSEIISAAFALFAEKGYAATKMEDIARAAGVSRGTPYLYFTNKEELFKAMLRDMLLPKLQEGEARLLAMAHLSAGEQLCALLQMWWQLQGETPLAALPKLMIAEAGNFSEVAEMYQKEFIEPGDAMIRALLQKGIASGEFRPLDVEYALTAICAPVVMAMVMRHSLTCCLPAEFDGRRYIQTLCDLLLQGLRAREKA